MSIKGDKSLFERDSSYLAWFVLVFIVLVSLGVHFVFDYYPLTASIGAVGLIAARFSKKDRVDCFVASLDCLKKKTEIEKQILDNSLISVWFEGVSSVSGEEEKTFYLENGSKVGIKREIHHFSNRTYIQDSNKNVKIIYKLVGYDNCSVSVFCHLKNTNEFGK